MNKKYLIMNILLILSICIPIVSLFLLYEVFYFQGIYTGFYVYVCISILYILFLLISEFSILKSKYQLMNKIIYTIIIVGYIIFTFYLIDIQIP